MLKANIKRILVKIDCSFYEKASHEQTPGNINMNHTDRNVYALKLIIPHYSNARSSTFIVYGPQDTSHSINNMKSMYHTLQKLTTFSATHRHNKKSAQDNYYTHSLKYRESLAFYAELLLLIHKCKYATQ